MTCICGREMTPVIGYDENGWRLWYTCFDHPGQAKLSTACFPLPPALSPPPIALSAEGSSL